MSAEAALSSELKALGLLPAFADDLAFDAAEETDGFRRWSRLIQRTSKDVCPLKLKSALQTAQMYPTHKKDEPRTW